MPGPALSRRASVRLRLRRGRSRLHVDQRNRLRQLRRSRLMLRAGLSRPHRCPTELPLRSADAARRMDVSGERVRRWRRMRLWLRRPRSGLRLECARRMRAMPRLRGPWRLRGHGRHDGHHAMRSAPEWLDLLGGRMACRRLRLRLWHPQRALPGHHARLRLRGLPGRRLHRGHSFAHRSHEQRGVHRQRAEHLDVQPQLLRRRLVRLRLRRRGPRLLDERRHELQDLQRPRKLLDERVSGDHRRGRHRALLELSEGLSCSARPGRSSSR